MRNNPAYTSTLIQPQASLLRRVVTGGWLLLFFCLAASAYSQSFDLKKYGAKEGLRLPFVYTVLQDQPGFIWLGTSEGLVRFDGMRFRTFTQKDGLANDFVTASFRDKENRLWFGHNQGGLTLWENGKFITLPTQEKIPSAIVGIVQDDYGNIWLASQRDGMVKVGRKREIIPFREILKGKTVYSLGYWGKGKFLVGTGEGLLVVKVSGANESPTLDHAVSSVPATRITCIVPSGSLSAFWVATEDAGLFAVRPGRIAGQDSVFAYGRKEGFPTAEISCLVENQSGDLWMSVNGLGLQKYAKQASRDWMAQPLTGPTDSLDRIAIKALLQDRNGQLWAGTYGQGAFCLSPKKFSLLETQGLPLQCMVEDSKHQFWIGTPAGLYQQSQYTLLQSQSFTLQDKMPLSLGKPFTTAQALPANEVKSLHEFPAGTLWIGTTNGLAKMDLATGRITPVPLSADELARSINDIAHDAAGTVWVGTRAGLFLIDAATLQFRNLSTSEGLPHNNVSDIYLSKENVMWVATRSSRVARWDGSKFTSVGLETETVMPEVNSITQSADGRLWFGTDGAGVFSLDAAGKSAIYTTEEGLISNFCYFVFADRNQQVWITHRNGISRLIPSTSKVIHYQEKDAFPVKETDLNHLMADDEDNLWFCTPQGLMRFDMKAEGGTPAAPVVFLTSFQVFDQERPMIDGQELPFDQYRFKFEFLGLTLTDQADVRYQYMLVGNDIDWSDASASTEAVYQGLGYGEYIFMVRASNKFGMWTEKPVTLRFVIAPPFYATWWFRVLVIAGAVALVFGFIRYRVYRFRKEKELLEDRIRERTAELRMEKEKLEMAYLEIQKLSLAVSETSNAIFILDHEGNLEWINNGFTRITGYTMPEIQELRKGNRFIDTSTNTDISKLLREAVAENKPVSYESKLPTKWGREVWVVSTLTPILDREGNLVNIVIIDSDISDRKKAEEEIQQMNHRLEQLVQERTRELAVANEQLKTENEEHIKTAEKLRLINEELDTFIYRASHDLKGPLASLLGLVNLSRAEVTDPGVLRYIDLMERSALRLDNILVDLLEATAVKQATPLPEPVLLHQSVEKVFAALREREAAGLAELVNEVPPLLSLLTDPKILMPVLQNLIDNGVKYKDPAKPLPRVVVKAETEGQKVKLTIADNGRGISPEQQEKVFDMFFRGDNNTRGSGLGLYIVKNAVEKLGGTIQLSSAPGVGSTFVIQLPLELKP